MPISLIESPANFNLLLTSHLSLARLQFFHLPYHPGASSCLSSKFPPLSKALLWSEMKLSTDERPEASISSSWLSLWAAPCQGEGLFSFFLSSSLHKLAVKTDLAVKSDDVITWIAWLWFHFSSEWKCKVEPEHEWSRSRVYKSSLKIQVKTQMNI